MKFVFTILTALAAAQGDFCTQNPSRNCKNTVQGLLPPNNKMPSTVITEPASNSQLNSNNGFRVRFSTVNFAPSGDRREYLSLPQTLNRDQLVEGFIQVSVQKLGSRNNLFVQRVDGNEVRVPRLRSTGVHRICTIMCAKSGQAVLMPVAQRGSQDDCIRVNLT